MVPVELGYDEDGVPFEDGLLVLRDARTLAWRMWGAANARPVLRLQGSVGSRLDRGPNPAAAGIRLIVADRPGFGASDRHPGHGLASVADDLVELLDAAGCDTVPVVAHSAGAPYGLALTANHPARVSSLTVISGACPIRPDERRGLVAVNAGLGRVLDHGWDAVHDYLAPVADRLVSAAATTVSDDRPSPGRDHLPPAGTLRNRQEALRQGIAGWVDETLAITGTWDVDVSTITTRVAWWHGANDTTIPLSAARRLVTAIPSAQLHVVPDRGHQLGARFLLDLVAEL